VVILKRAKEKEILAKEKKGKHIPEFGVLCTDGQCNQFESMVYMPPNQQ